MMPHEKVDKLREELILLSLFTEEELTLITNMNGYTVDTLELAIFARYGYHSLKSMLKGDE